MGPTKDKIFTLALCPGGGSQGKDTRIHYSQPCSTCGRDPTPRTDYLEYCVDWWDGEDLVDVGSVYCVTPKLLQALKKAGIVGIDFRTMKTTRSTHLEQRDPDRNHSLPEFVEMIIPSECSAGSGWLDRVGVCDGCGQTLWEYTSRLAEGVTAAAKAKTGPPRSVYSDSWNGEDVFRLDDGGPPIVTERFVDVLSQVGVMGVKFHPARWLDKDEF